MSIESGPAGAVKPRKKIGGISLALAVSGFIIVQFQPWINLEALVVFGGLTMKGLLAAFFEASTVGALADWFAVTALFKNPLGIRLPHTDILAKNKNAIADAVPRFLSGFVSRDAIETELGRVDFAAKIAQFLEAAICNGEIGGTVRRRVSELIQSYGGSEDRRRESLRSFASGLLDFLAQKIDAPKTAAALLRWARNERYDETLLDSIAESLREGIGRNRVKLVRILTPILKENAGWQGLFMGAGTVERVLAGVQNALTEIKNDKTNEARRFILQAVTEAAARLAGEAPDPANDRAKLKAAFTAVLADEGLRDALGRLFGKLLASLGEDLLSADSIAADAMDRIERVLISRIRDDRALHAELNALVASILGAVIEQGRIVEGLTEYLAGLLRSTDERMFVRRVEDAVWNDLQYIRVNGAVVGGLVGLFIALVKAVAA
jgi:uncharacterized membrane-anchored protein YjiN (DUF445 family)